MKSASAGAGTISGCLVWLVLFFFGGMCLMPVALVFNAFTSASDLSASIVGPMVCPAHSTARIVDAGTTDIIDSQGVEQSAAATAMVCEDAAGKVVLEPDPLPFYIWDAITCLFVPVVAGILALLLAAPLGGGVAWLVGKIKPVRAAEST